MNMVANCWGPDNHNSEFPPFSSGWRWKPARLSVDRPGWTSRSTEHPSHLTAESSTRRDIQVNMVHVSSTPFIKPSFFPSLKMSPLYPCRIHILSLKDVKRILWIYLNSGVKMCVSCLSDSLTTRAAKMERLRSHLGNCGASVTGQSPGGREKEGRYWRS